MPESAHGESLLLPERARLLHIGPMKTGTTSLQSTVRDRRTELLDHGVLYPGKRLNHRREIGALTGRGVALHAKSGSIHPRDQLADGVPPRREWDDLMAEVNAETSRRVLISHELIGDSSDELAQQFIDELGPRTHVVITLRSPAAILPSQWCQSLKSARFEEFDAWLERVFSRAKPPMSDRFQRAQDQAGIVERWSNIVGPDKVTVVIVDKSQPDLLGHAFEDLLGLPRDFLSAENNNGATSNRSMTLTEAEYIRRINKTLADESVDWTTYTRVFRNGVIDRILAKRVPPPDEPRVRLPTWAAELAVERGRTYADAIAQSGVRVVGDLASLYAPTSQSSSDAAVNLPPDLGVEAVVGAVHAARKWKSKKTSTSAKRSATTGKAPRPGKVPTRRKPGRLVRKSLRRGLRIARRVFRRGR